VSKKPFVAVGVLPNMIRQLLASTAISTAFTLAENPARGRVVEPAVLISAKSFAVVLVATILQAAADWNASYNILSWIKFLALPFSPCIERRTKEETNLG